MMFTKNKEEVEMIHILIYLDILIEANLIILVDIVLFLHILKGSQEEGLAI